MRDLISIIVPVFRVEPYIKRCVDSILAQTYSNIEVILVDDGSDDGCPAICDEYKKKDSRVVVVHKPNGGLSSARNAGIRIAKGKYIGFVDSDDAIEADMYEFLWKKCQEHQADIGIVGFEKWDGVTPYCEYTESTKETVYSGKEMRRAFLRVDNPEAYVEVWSRLYKKELLEDTFFTEGVINEDVDFSYRVFLKCDKVVVSDAQKYKYVISNTSITRNAFSPKDLDLYKVWSNVVDLAKEKDLENVCHATLNYKRVDFTLLLKYAMFGIKGFENPREVIYEMQQRLKKNRSELVRSKGLTLSRKIALYLVTSNLKFVKFLFDKGILHKYL